MWKERLGARATFAAGRDVSLRQCPEKLREVPNCTGLPGCVPELGMAGVWIDITWSGSNNRAVAKPESVRRIKSYSAVNGYVYQFYFYELNRVEVDGQAAGEFVYAISADRGASFGLRIL